MADKQPSSNGHDKSTVNGDRKDDTNLSDFVTRQYDLQKDSGNMAASKEIDDERTANFYKRAVGESVRMSKEVAKSQVKMQQLRDELGAEMIDSWRQEHAAEVLTAHQAQLVENTHN